MIEPSMLAPYAFMPWGALTGSVPQVPDFYWNAVSDEQRWKQLCVNIQRMADWSKDFSETVNSNFKELDNRFPVTDGELAQNVPVTRCGRVENITVSANSARTLEVNYPSSLATGAADAVILTVEDKDTHNMTAQLVERDSEGFTALIVNNSVSDATVTLNYMVSWNTRPQPIKEQN